MELPERLAGAVWGHLVGDAIGVPYEFLPPGQIHEVVFGASGTHRQPPGTWSDDGSLMLALLDSLLRERAADEPRFEPTDQAARFLRWADHGAYTPDGEGKFDIGNTTSAAFDRLRSGTAAERAGGTDARSNGNGSLMRILPLALVERDVSDEVLVEHARRSSSITHGHPIDQTACALYVLVARRLLLGSAPAAALTDAITTLRRIDASGDEPGHPLAALDVIEGWTERSGRGYVVDSLWSAWDAFVGAASHAETIERAVRYGNDTDTTAAIAGGLAGAFWGIEGIPPDWLAGMRGREVIDPLVDRLVGANGWKTSANNPIRVDWVDLKRIPRYKDYPGRLGMTFTPGKRHEGYTADHWRDLDADVERLRAPYGVDTLLLLIEDHELRLTRTERLAETLERASIELLRHPVRDLGVPSDRGAFAATLAAVRERVMAGRSVAVACLGGHGRTGTAVGCLLRDGGLGANEAIDLTRATRRGTIDVPGQPEFVRAWDQTDG